MHGEHANKESVKLETCRLELHVFPISTMMKSLVITLQCGRIMQITIGDDFIMEVRSSEDVEIHGVTQNNRRLLTDFILNRISEILMHHGKYFPSMDKYVENPAL